jgi:hypothetical protein
MLAALAVIGLTTGACTKNYYPTQPTPIPSTTTPTTPDPDVIEYRVFGTVGAVPTVIKWSDAIDGLTVLTNESLPYTTTIRSTDAELFVLLEADANAILGYGSLQVQIVINGRVFREAYTSGYGPLTATASGTWRRGS